MSGLRIGFMAVVGSLLLFGVAEAKEIKGMDKILSNFPTWRSAIKKSLFHIVLFVPIISHRRSSPRWFILCLLLFLFF